MASFRDLVRQPRGRWFVLGGTLAAIAALVLAAVSGWHLYAAFMAALGAGAAVMIFCGVAERFWENKKVSTAQIPGGGGVGFEEGVRDTLTDLNRRVTEQMEDVNRRLYDLEKRVFKDDGSGDEWQERKE